MPSTSIAPFVSIPLVGIKDHIVELAVGVSDAILPRKGSINRAMTRRLQDDWARDVGEGHRVFMSLRVDFEPIG